jgi:uncharacterized membrane protein
MRTPASIASHPIHPMLVPLPMGLWIFSLACDLLHVFWSPDPAWKTVASYTMAGGVVGALIAAVPGLIDLLSLPARPRKTALIHMSINLTIVVLYVVNLWLRMAAAPGAQDAAMDLPVWLSVVAVALLAISGWLGGHLVYVENVAVQPKGGDVAPDR